MVYTITLSISNISDEYGYSTNISYVYLRSIRSTLDYLETTFNQSNRMKYLVPKPIYRYILGEDIANKAFSITAFLYYISTKGILFLSVKKGFHRGVVNLV